MEAWAEKATGSTSLPSIPASSHARELAAGFWETLLSSPETAMTFFYCMISVVTIRPHRCHGDASSLHSEPCLWHLCFRMKRKANALGFRNEGQAPLLPLPGKWPSPQSSPSFTARAGPPPGSLLYCPSSSGAHSCPTPRTPCAYLI